MVEISLDVATHRYSVDGKPVHGVTHILEASGMKSAKWTDEAAMRKGTLVHQTIELAVEGDLDRASLDERLVPYLEAFCKWQHEMGVEDLQSEQRVFHPLLHYCGTLDILAKVRGALYVVDLKSGSPDHWHPIQTAAYAMAWVASLPGPAPGTPKRAALYLSEDGKYNWIAHPKREDFDDWKAALRVARWRLEKGLTE